MIYVYAIGGLFLLGFGGLIGFVVYTSRNPERYDHMDGQLQELADTNLQEAKNIIAGVR